MEITGERYMPDIDGDWTLEHTHRYFATRELAKGKTVLDIACGEGYGSRLLADVAKRAIGIDISFEAVSHAAGKYAHPRLSFVRGSAAAIPLTDNSVDIVASFETIEHITEHEAMIAEIRRVLRPGGLLVMSSPDKYEYSDVPGYVNEFHVKELYRQEFEDLLKTRFSHIQILGQRIVFGSVMGSEAEGGFISWAKNSPESRTVGLSEAEYIIAIAGDGPLPALPSSILKTPVDQSNRARELSNQLNAYWLHTQHIEAYLKILEAQRESLQNTLQDVYSSRSWKITAPLRFAVGELRRLLGREQGEKVDSPVPQKRKKSVWPPDVHALERTISLDPDAGPTDTRVGVFLHIYYTDLMEEMLECLLHVPKTAPVHISTDTETKRRTIEQRFAWAGLGERTEVRVCPNMGWDIGPFLVGFADRIPEYDLILRLHSKHSKHIEFFAAMAWRKSLYASLAGNHSRVNSIIKAFADTPDLGMVCPPISIYHSDKVHAGGNLFQMQKLLLKHDIQITKDTPLDFPMGSMFWCRPQVLAPWLEAGLSYEDFCPTVESERDGSLAHALERLFFFGCGISGHTWARVENLPHAGK